MSYQPFPPLGQSTKSGSLPVTISSDQVVVMTLSGSTLPTNAAQETGGNLATLVTRTPVLGQATKAGSAPIVFASDQSGQAAASSSLSVALANENVQDQFVTGQSAQSTLGNNIFLAVAGSGSFDSLAGTPAVSYRSFYVQVIGSAGISAGQIIFEGSNDNTTFVALTVYDDALTTGIPINAAFAIAASTNRYFSGKSTYRYIRCRISTAFVGGTVQAITRFSILDYVPRVLTVAQGTGANLNVVIASGTITTLTTLSQFLASAADADGTANPTTTGIRTFEHYFNGTTFDRKHGNWNTTTTDTGAKVASGNGATQTNFDARGAKISVILGTVSGTFTTFQFQLQYSPDGGTTWVNYGAATTNDTAPASGNVYVFDVYPGVATQANNAKQYVFMNAALPRTWRLTWVIAGTTPSATIASANVNYQL